MAYSSSRGSSSYGRSGGPRGGGGGQNMMAYAVAGILVLLVIVFFFFMSGSKKKKLPDSAATTAPPTQPVVAPPTKPAEKPWPAIADAKLAEGRKLASSFDADAAKAKAIYKEANEAKQKGDTTTWQSKLKEMRFILENIKDQWNEFIATMPKSPHYDSEDVAKHYFSRESGQVQNHLKLLAASKSDER